MSQSDHSPFLHPTRLDIPPEIRTYVVTLLSQTLACTVDLRSHVKQAAWNVKGPDFSQLHAFFITIATALDTYADLVAERVAALGGMVRGAVRRAATQSTLPEYPGDIVEGSAHVLALAERVALYATTLRASITYAADVEDTVTAAIYTDIARGVEKWLWGLEAHLHGWQGTGGDT